MKIVSSDSRRSPRKRILRVVLTVVGIGLVAAMIKIWSTPKEVDYDTEPTDVASLPTAPFYNEADEANRRGYAWAKKEGVVSHSRCKAEAIRGESGGCDKYVTEQKHIPPTPTEADLRKSASAAECEVLVRAYYGPLFQDMQERGDSHAVSVWMRRRMWPDLKSCRQVDIRRSLSVIYEPTERLKAMIERVQSGQTLSDSDVERVRLDYAGVQGYMADAKRNNYLELAEQLFKISGGRERFVPDGPVMDEKDRERCVDLRTKIDSLKIAYREANEEVARSAVTGSVAADPDAMEAAVREQQKSMNEWSELGAESKALGCPRSN